MYTNKRLGYLVGALLCVGLLGCGKTDKVSTAVVTSEDSTNPIQNTETIAENRVELDEENTDTKESQDIVAEVNTLNRFEQFNDFAKDILATPSVVYDGTDFNVPYTEDIESSFKENDYAVESYWTSSEDVEITGDPNYYGKVEGIVLPDIGTALNSEDVHYVPSSSVNVPVTNISADTFTLDYQLMTAETAFSEIEMLTEQVGNYDIANEEGNVRFIDGSSMEFGVISEQPIGPANPETFIFVTLKPLGEMSWDVEYTGEEEIGVGEIMTYTKVGDGLYMRTELLAKDSAFTYEQIEQIYKYLKVLR